MSGEAALLVIDQGSTATKAAALGPRGEVLCSRTVTVDRQVEGRRITHDAHQLARQIERLIAELTAATPIRAIGLTCQRSTCLWWDRASGEPVTPALSWQDTTQAERMDALGASRETVVQLTGLPASPHYAAPKLAALLDELPRGRERAETGELVAGTLDAFLVRRLTGRDATEPGHAGRTLLCNLESGDWSDELCALFGVPRPALPAILPSAALRGSYRDLPVVAVAGDQQAALLGHGGWAGGQLVAHFGTGAFVLASTGATTLRHGGLLSAVLASTRSERRFQLEGSVNSAGSAVDWACRLTGRDVASHPDRPLDPERLPLLLPAFTGLAAPFWRPRARGALVGLTLDAGPEEVIDGALCGVALRVLDCVEALENAGAVSGDTPLRVSGRLTRFAGLVGLLADAGQRLVEIAPEEEQGLEGIRRLAEAALAGNDGALREPPGPGRRREPEWPPDRARRTRDRWRDAVSRL